MHLARAIVSLLALSGALAEPCAEGEEGACPAQERDASALLQHPARRVPGHRLQTRTNVVMMNAGNSTKPRKRHRVPFLKRVHETEHDCDELKKVLHRVPGLRKAGHLFRYMCNDDGRERLSQLKDGCLYLPDSKHMTVLYQSVDHPNPWHFFDMFEDSFFPATGHRCPTDAPGSSATTLEGTAAETCSEGSGFAGVDGACIHAKLVGSTPKAGSNVRVYKLDGCAVQQSRRAASGPHGLGPDVGEHHRGRGRPPDDREGRHEEHDRQPQVELVELRQRCPGRQERRRLGPGAHAHAGGFCGQAGRDAAQAYAGDNKCQGTLSYTLHKADSGFRFVEDGIVRITHPACASDCSENIPTLTGAFAKREDGLVKAVLCETQLLGIASFPGYAESQRILIVNPDSLPGGAMLGAQRLL